MGDYSRDFSISYDESRGSCTIVFRCFDTPNSVTLFGVGGSDGPDGKPQEQLVQRPIGAERAEALLLVVRSKCLEFHRLWSFSLPESDVTRINSEGREFEVDLETAQLVQAMKDFNEAEPLFDFTVGPVSYIWKHAEHVPDPGRIATALDLVDASKVHVIFPGAGRGGAQGRAVIAKELPRMLVDVGGAAKGYAADWIADFLRMNGVESADIDLGGNVYMVGSHPTGRPWRVAVRLPKGMQIEKPVVEVRDKSVVTSGSYERFVEIGGVRYHHIIDPATGWPSNSDLVSATAISASSLEADMLATAALLVGSTGFAELAKRHVACGLIAITEAGEVLKAGVA